MNTSTTLSLGFDYDSIENTSIRATLRSEATAIKAAVKRTHDDLIEIGSRLLNVKEITGHGTFMEWVNSEFGLSYDKANDFMNVSKAFSKLDNSPTLKLSQSAIFALSAPSVPEEVRVEALGKAESGEIKTIADTKAFIQSRIESPPIEITNSEPEAFTPPVYAPSGSPMLRVHDEAVRQHVEKKQAYLEELNSLDGLKECAEFFLKNRKALEREPAKMDTYCNRLRKALK